MKLIRLGQTLCEGASFPPQPPTANALLFLRKNTHMFQGFANDDCSIVYNPPRSSDDSTMQEQGPITKWEDYNGSGVYAEQTTCVDCPLYYYGYGFAIFDTDRFFDLNTPVSLTGEFTIYFRAVFSSTNSKALIGGDTSNFWRVTNNKSFRLRIDGTPNHDFTEVTDTIATSVGIKSVPYICVLSRDASGYLSMFVHDGPRPYNYNDKAWGSTTNQDTDTMTISNVGAKEDDVQNFSGWMSDVLVYDTHHDSAQRNQVYQYIG